MSQEQLDKLRTHDKDAFEFACGFVVQCLNRARDLADFAFPEPKHQCQIDVDMKGSFFMAREDQRVKLHLGTLFWSECVRLTEGDALEFSGIITNALRPNIEALSVQRL